MKHLYPKDFLIFLKSIKSIDDLSISNIQISEPEKHSLYVEISMLLNNKEYLCYIPVEWVKSIGAFYYFDFCKAAKLEVAETIFNQLEDYFENIYVPWIENDTGIKMDKEYQILAMKEINRLKELFKQL
jgi:hypothetical protein